LGETHTLGCESVDVWRLDMFSAKASGIAVTHVIGHDYYNIWPVQTEAVVGVTPN
jgi:hypothetical protein